MSNVNNIESSIGMNRTGIGLSPILSAEMIEGAAHTGVTPSQGAGELEIGHIRQSYTSQQEQLGTLPPPSSLKGMATTAVEMMKGKRPTVFLDRLGDRLAFERTGVRLYTALLDKFDALGSWQGGPTRAELETIRQDELRHFELLRQTLASLGADATAVTPAADASGVEALGVLQVLADPRTTLPQAMHAILTIELVDNDAWRMLIDLAKLMDHDSLLSQMQAALLDEDRHLSQVRAWLMDEARLAVRRELQPEHAN